MELHEWLDKQTRQRWPELSARLKDALLQPLARRDLQLRTELGKLLVHLASASDADIRRVFARRRPLAMHDVHFTLAMQIELEISGRASDRARRLAAILADFLIMVRSEHGRAAFMTGCVLGSSFPRAIAERELKRALRHARFRAGLNGVRHGFEELSYRLHGQHRHRVKAFQARARARQA